MRGWSIPKLGKSQHFELDNDYYKVTVQKGNILDYTIQREAGKLVVRHDNGGSIAVADRTDGKCSLKELGLGTDSYNVKYLDKNLMAGYKNDGAGIYVAATENESDNLVFIDCADKVVTAGQGEDTVYVFKSQNTVLKGDSGNDVLTAFGGADNMLVGGTGDDSYKVISSLGHGKTITIEQHGASEYDSDILILSKVKKKDISYSLDGTGLVLTNKNNNGQIKINNYLEQGLEKIVFSDGVLSEKQVFGILQDLRGNQKTGLDVIKSFMHSLDITAKSGMSALDEAIKICSQGKYSSAASLINEFTTLCTSKAGNSEDECKDFLKKYCGIDLDNADTGAITGYDAGGLKVKTATSIVKEDKNISVDNFAYNPYALKQEIVPIYNYKSSNGYTTHGISDQKQNHYVYKNNGITYYWNESNWASLGIDINVGRQIVGAVITSWAGASMDLISESYGLHFNGKGSKLAKAADGSRIIYINLFNDANNGAVATQSSSYRYVGYKETMYQSLNLNAKYFPSVITDINGDTVSNKSWSSGFIDRTIAHEFTHGVMSANIDCFHTLPQYIIEGAAELVHGIDDERQNTILNFIKNSQNISAVFNTSGNIGTMTYAGGYVLLRYLAKQAADYLNSSTMNSYMAGNDIANPQYFDSVTKAELSFNKGTNDIGMLSYNTADHDKKIMVFGANA